ncbi:hypothetical protein VNO78_05629 [Psophocarpus tetragonolobus]|uniref:Uncharacterized protein n=1 Tax=Psophocarpus tetragonolobus TaxID=3891 RepID=A0AAN9SR56_PSOTE
MLPPKAVKIASVYALVMSTYPAMQGMSKRKNHMLNGRTVTLQHVSWPTRSRLEARDAVLSYHHFPTQTADSSFEFSETMYDNLFRWNPDR